MSNYARTISATVFALGLTATVSAMPLSEYNLVLFGDYNFGGGEVEGKTFIGGNIKAAGMGADFGSKAPSFEDTLSVVGDINAANIQIQNGNLVYGGTLNANVNMNGGGTIRQDTSLSIDGVRSELESTSQTYRGLGNNGVYSSGTLQYTGTDSTAVFNIDATDLFAQNTSLQLQSGSAETVVINVSGTDIVAGGGVNLTNGFHHQDIGAGNIIWNFYEAESIDFNNIAMFGAVLALGADITGGAVFDGAVAANTYTGGREFHNFLFNPPSVDVSEPGAIALFGLGLVALMRRRKKN